MFNEFVIVNSITNWEKLYMKKLMQKFKTNSTPTPTHYLKKT